MVEPPKLDWTGWSDTAKPWDKDKPFHRYKCPTIRGPQATGRGYDCGCRLPTEVPYASALEMVVSLKRDPRNLIRTIPAWVPVQANGKIVTAPQELEGVLLRGYQTWTDHPPYQYHRWYDWNFMVAPADGFEYLLGPANNGGPIEKDEDNPNFTQALIRDLGKGGNIAARSMECEFDCGLFGSRFGTKGLRSSGFMFEWDSADQDLAWPMTGQYFWGRGNWIYDCGHPTSDFKEGDNAGLTRSELHPMTAMATARWEAFQFPENGSYRVPAIQFMFFATAEGGYTDPERRTTLPTEKIEFILDLPEHPAQKGPMAIGHTPGVPHNTFDMPRLLKHVNFTSFESSINKTSKGTGRSFKGSKVEPLIEVIPNKEHPGALPKQVKVTFPFGSAIGPNSADYYGMILSLGWLDPDLSQARRVRKVKVTFDHVEPFDSHDYVFGISAPGEFQIRYGVNGRWGQERREKVKKGTPIPLNNHKTVEFYLCEDDPIRIACQGEETDRVHDVYMESTDDERTIRMEKAEVLFFTGAGDIKPAHRAKSYSTGSEFPEVGPETSIPKRAVTVDEPGPMFYFEHCMPRAAGESADLVYARWVMSAVADMLMSTLAVENDPLGRIDPHHHTNEGDIRNPITPLEVGAKKQGRLTGLLSKEIGHSAELAEDPKHVDYYLFFTIETEPQKIGL